MGQQQLLLLIAAVVIVGLATIVGIRAATENQTKANSDALVQDAIRIASDAQQWKQKPAPFGGQKASEGDKSDPADFGGLDTFSELGYTPDPAANDLYKNVNGCYQINATSTELTITGTNDLKKNLVTITVDGITDSDINQSSIKIGTAGSGDILGCTGS